MKGSFDPTDVCPIHLSVVCEFFLRNALLMADTTEVSGEDLAKVHTDSQAGCALFPHGINTEKRRRSIKGSHQIEVLMLSVLLPQTLSKGLPADYFGPIDGRGNSQWHFIRFFPGGRFVRTLVMPLLWATTLGSPARSVDAPPGVSSYPSFQEGNFPDQEQLRVKGEAYAAESGTSWKAQLIKDDLTDQEQMVVISNQKLGKSSIVQVEGRCHADGIIFTATLFTSNGDIDPNLSFQGLEIGAARGMKRVNELPATQAVFLQNEKYTNSVNLVSVFGRATRAQFQKNAKSNPMISFVLPFASLARSEDIWRFIARIPTSVGDADVKIPFFAPEVRALVVKCDGQGE